LSTRAEQLQWRRAMVVELKARGMNHSEIAQELKVSRTCIVADANHLREQAKRTIKEYVTEHLPEQYQVCLTALDVIIKRAFDILQDSYDNREKLHAMELFKETHVTKLELLSNATTIDHALEYIRSKQQSQQNKANEDTSDNPSNSTPTGGKQSVF
jgi:transposase